MSAMRGKNEEVTAGHDWPLRWVLGLILLTIIGGNSHCQVLGTMTWERPCEINGQLRTCRISFPIAVDPATGIGALQLPQAPPPPPSLGCIGPFLRRESPSRLSVGASWTDANPCRIDAGLWPPLASGAGFFTVSLTRPVLIDIPAGKSCEGFVWVDRGAVQFGSGACQLPGSAPEVPPFGSLILGRYRADSGTIVEVVNSSVPELVHDSWVVRFRNIVP